MSQESLFGDAPPEVAPPIRLPKPYAERPAAGVAILRNRATRCRYCPAEVVFAMSTRVVRGVEKPRRMIIDLAPDPHGTVHLFLEGRVLRAVVLGRKADRHGRDDLHRDHHATCPHVDQWRRGPTGGAR